MGLFCNVAPSSGGNPPSRLQSEIFLPFCCDSCDEEIQAVLTWVRVHAHVVDVGLRLDGGEHLALRCTEGPKWVSCTTVSVWALFCFSFKKQSNVAEIFKALRCLCATFWWSWNRRTRQDPADRGSWATWWAGCRSGLWPAAAGWSAGHRAAPTGPNNKQNQSPKEGARHTITWKYEP